MLESKQIGMKRSCRLVTRRGIVGHRPRNDRVESPWHFRVELGGRRRSVAHDPHRDFDQRSSTERGSAGRAFVEGDSEREDVGACVDVPSQQLFGRHESRRANRASLPRQTFHRLGISKIVRCELRESEVQHLQLSTWRDDDVLRLDVTMNDAGGVGHLQRQRRLDADVHHFAGRQRVSSDPLGQAQPLDVLHDDEDAVVLFADFMDGADVGMVNATRQQPPVVGVARAGSLPARYPRAASYEHERQLIGPCGTVRLKSASAESRTLRLSGTMRDDHSKQAVGSCTV